MVDLTPTLKDQGILLRPLVQGDFEGLFSCAGDKKVWAGHPNKDRYKRNVFELWFAKAIECANTLTIIDDASNKIIGSTRFYCDGVPENAVAIGYTFLAWEYWGGRTNKELKALMLDYAFVNYSSVWLHVSPKNIRSQKATLKLGAQYRYDKVISLSGGEPVRYKCYEISREDWFKKTN